MKENNLNFETENLVVDYITFKFQHLEDSTKTKIANYLSLWVSNLGFISFILNNVVDFLGLLIVSVEEITHFFNK